MMFCILMGSHDDLTLVDSVKNDNVHIDVHQFQVIVGFNKEHAALGLVNFAYLESCSGLSIQVTALMAAFIGQSDGKPYTVSAVQ